MHRRSQASQGYTQGQTKRGKDGGISPADLRRLLTSFRGIASQNVRYHRNAIRVGCRDFGEREPARPGGGLRGNR